jgi:hypothetical protein
MGQSRVQAVFYPPSVASLRGNTQLLAEMYGFPATFHWVQVKVGGRKCQGLVPLEYVQLPRAKVQAPLKHVFATMTAVWRRAAMLWPCGERLQCCGSLDIHTLSRKQIQNLHPSLCAPWMTICCRNEHTMQEQMC